MLMSGWCPVVMSVEPLVLLRGDLLQGQEVQRRDLERGHAAAVGEAQQQVRQGHAHRHEHRHAQRRAHAHGGTPAAALSGVEVVVVEEEVVEVVVVEEEVVEVVPTGHRHLPASKAAGHASRSQVGSQRAGSSGDTAKPGLHAHVYTPATFTHFRCSQSLHTLTSTHAPSSSSTSQPSRHAHSHLPPGSRCAHSVFSRAQGSPWRHSSACATASTHAPSLQACAQPPFNTSHIQGALLQTPHAHRNFPPPTVSTSVPGGCSLRVEPAESADSRSGGTTRETPAAGHQPACVRHRTPLSAPPHGSCRHEPSDDTDTHLSSHLSGTLCHAETFAPPPPRTSASLVGQRRAAGSVRPIQNLPPPPPVELSSRPRAVARCSADRSVASRPVHAPHASRALVKLSASSMRRKHVSASHVTTRRGAPSCARTPASSRELARRRRGRGGSARGFTSFISCCARGSAVVLVW
ncbi:LOW QUALITY PROTEIN: hypothetical protein CRUP_021687 [Coryphaenoides rupestris]|nr:LOW QUALITY PROTEIN: hypothetical protein CRUP_021687 [Coryphaenoides rupestris]